MRCAARDASWCWWKTAAANSKTKSGRLSESSRPPSRNWSDRKRRKRTQRQNAQRSARSTRSFVRHSLASKNRTKPCARNLRRHAKSLPLSVPSGSAQHRSRRPLRWNGPTRPRQNARWTSSRRRSSASPRNAWPRLRWGSRMNSPHQVRSCRRSRLPCLTSMRSSFRQSLSSRARSQPRRAFGPSARQPRSVLKQKSGCFTTKFMPCATSLKSSKSAGRRARDWPRRLSTFGATLRQTKRPLAARRPIAASLLVCACATRISRRNT
mmetsp:Transcript_19166/g.61333  ORF Transcript_19166/g.61333 Transcript_19166/m.61333 type:complete len:267 (+) Transcript_19166:891-1691(+)